MKFYTTVAIHKNDILLRGYEDGISIQKAIPYKPYLFLRSDKGTEFETIHGEKVVKLEFDSIKKARDYISGADENKIYGMHRFVYPFIFDNYPGQIEYKQSLIRVANIDIEVASDKGFPSIEDATCEITAITIMLGGLIYALGCGEFTTEDPKVTYYKCDNEEHLLQRFLEMWELLNPDVVTGWNIETFDIPYIINRITRVMGERNAKRLSPWRMLRERTVKIHGKDMICYNPVGVAVLDYLAIYKKYTYNDQSSFSLNNIASVELGEKKIDYSDYGSLINLYRENHQLFMEYNIRDVQLVDRIDQKKRLLSLVFALTYDTKINMEDALTSVTMWDVLIHNYLLEQKKVVPFSKSGVKTPFPGAYVKEPKVGLYNWVTSFDLTSLYPHIIMQYNISAETYRGKMDVDMDVDKVIAGGLTPYLPWLKEQNYAVAANLCLYSRDQKGFMPALMEKLFAQRKESNDEKKRLEVEYVKTKDKSLLDRIDALDNRQAVLKVVLNSLYGVLGNAYFRWFQVEHAEAITLSGQFINHCSAARVNEYLNGVLKPEKEKDYIIAMDTDSLYLDLGDMVEKYLPGGENQKIVKFLDRASKQIITVLNDRYESLAEYTNAYANRMSTKREFIAENGIWTGKKRYALNTWAKETVFYDQPKIKVVGLESKKSSFPLPCRKAMEKTIHMILQGGTEAGVMEYIKQFRAEFNQLPIDEIGLPIGVNNLEEYKSSVQIYSKGTPKHVKGSLIYNVFLKRKKVTNLPQIYSGDKVKMYYLITPNPVHDEVISIPLHLPAEFGLEKYIDKDALFDRSYLHPVERMLDAIGWKSKKENTLEGIFG